jgi:hypothetical protein
MKRLKNNDAHFPALRHSGVTRTFPSQRRDIDIKTLGINYFLVALCLHAAALHG